MPPSAAPCSLAMTVAAASATAAATPTHAPVLRHLSTLDRFLPLGIFAATGLGLPLGRLRPPLGALLDVVRVAGALLSDLPGHRNALILIGPARCIAMALIWNSIATVVPGWRRAERTVVDVSMGEITTSVATFLVLSLCACRRFLPAAAPSTR
jgi:hypothetical protein